MKLKITKKTFSFLKDFILKSCILLLVLSSNYKMLSQDKTYTIDDPEDLRNVIYQPGDLIILKNGTYSTDERMRFLGSGTAEKPVTFRAETPGGVVFTGGARLTIGGESENSVTTATGEYLVVDGFHWKGGYGASNFIEFRNGNNYAHHSTIQNCVIDGLQIEPSDLAEDIIDNSITKHRWIVLYGTYNSVLNCTFMNKKSAGALILAEYAYNAFPEVADGEPEINTSCNLVGHTISNNYFYNFEKMDATKSNAGDSETIRIGTSEYQNVNSGALVHNNYFVKADGENEIITNKSKNNTYTNNTFRQSRGSLVLRHGSNALVDGNYFLGENVDGTGGIRITDSNHTITNNYIQDCITVFDQAKWNNGITFIGGSDNAAVDCNSTNVSNGYQKSENIIVSNNSIVNTNAPLFYNTDKGSTDPTGTVSNNLIYFAENNPNITSVISGDTETSYANLGTALTYSGNVFTGTTLGKTNAGFSEETGITATPNGEIFTFTGTGSANKGANLGNNSPITDAMVGYGIGACFLDSAGASINNGNCTIAVTESLTVSSLSSLAASASSNDIFVTANVGWQAVVNDNWISIDINAGNGNATISLSVTKNEQTTSRTGSVTFTQTTGSDAIERTLNITQEGADLTDLYPLINNVAGGGPVSIHSFSKEQTEGGRTNFAVNTLDKDLNTQWTADDQDVLAGDYKSDGEFIIFDLSKEYQLDLIQIATDDKADPYGFQIWVSTTGTETTDFTKILPTSGDLQITTTTGTREGFDQYQITANARYVKLLSFGRFNVDGNSRKSQWSNITEIEFFGEAAALSTTNFDLENFTIYPVPSHTILKLKNYEDLKIKSIKIYNAVSASVIEVRDYKENIDISKLSKGIYFLKAELDNGKTIIKKIIKL